MLDGKPWTPERLTTLKARWLDGATGQEIANELGGVTRNAVLGKIHRLDLDRAPRRRPIRSKAEKSSGQIKGPNVRKAYASKGDDTTLTRFVKVKVKGEQGVKHKPRSPKLPGFEAPFVKEARTKFPTTVKPVAAIKNLLVSGHSNVKIGRDVRKGHLRGYWIYTLSLEERKTCPSSCQHWQSCYGNNMPFAQRVDHTDPEFLIALEKEIATLCAHKRIVGGKMIAAPGILIRLHALGDFYSPEYVLFWDRMLREHDNLAIYGYTAWPRFDTAIGAQIDWLNGKHGRRSMIRFSNGDHAGMSTVTIGSEESCPPNAFICPEQTDKTLACATCGACWSTDKNVAFLEH